jgi:hypothetical protein
MTKVAIYLSLGLHKRTSKIQEKSSSLKRERLALQNLNFFTFIVHFGPPGAGTEFQIQIRIQPTKMNAFPLRIRIRNTGRNIYLGRKAALEERMCVRMSLLQLRGWNSISCC